MTSTAIAATAPRSPATCQPVKPHSLNAAPPVENSVAAAKTRRRNAAWLARSSSISGPWQACPPAPRRVISMRHHPPQELAMYARSTILPLATLAALGLGGCGGARTGQAAHEPAPAPSGDVVTLEALGKVSTPPTLFEALPVLRLHYLTLGRLRRDAGGSARNAVLILHGTGGSGSQFLSPLFAGELYGPGQPLDTTTHYLILPDNLGHGRSSKPSDGLKARFPHYTYGDMVAAQYRLVTDGLHVDHLLLVMGTSMGCMHSWLWAERHPDFMDGVVPLACAPTQIAGRNRMMRRMIIEDIRGDPDWRGGTYSQQPRGLLAALQLLFMMSSSPLQLQRTAPTRDSADA